MNGLEFLLKFDANKFALFFTPTMIVLTILIIIMAIAIYNRKNRKIELKKSEKGEKILENEEENIVKTIYMDANNNSKTEFLPIPEKLSTKEFDYIFAGYDKEYEDNKKVYYKPVFIKKPIQYVVNVFGEDKDKPIASFSVNYGAGVNLDEIVPTKTDDGENSFRFVGWDKPTNNIEKDTNIYAVFEPVGEKKDTENLENYNEESDMQLDKHNEIETTVEFNGSQEQYNESENFETSKNFDTDEALTSSDGEFVTEENEKVPESTYFGDVFINENSKQITDEINENSSYLESDFDLSKNDFSGKAVINDEKLDINAKNIDKSYNDKNTENVTTIPQEDENSKKSNINLSNIKIGKHINDGRVGRTRSRKGFKIEIFDTPKTAFSIDVDNKSENDENDDIFKRIGVNLRQPKKIIDESKKTQNSFQNNNKTANISENLKKNNENIIINNIEGPFKSRKLERLAREEERKKENEKDNENNKNNSNTEEFLSNTIMVNHKKIVK